MLKLVFGLALLFFIGYKIYSSDAASNIFDLKLTDKFLVSFLFFIGLIGVNWGLETLKWKLLLNEKNELTFGNAFKLVLAGIATGIMTPNRVGNFIGRAHSKLIGDKENAIAATFLANIAQFMATLSIGLIALVLMPHHIEAEINKTLIYGSAIVLQLLALFVFIKPNNQFIRKVTRRFAPRFIPKIEELAELRTNKKLVILGLAVLRYGIIIAQFYLVLSFFIDQLDMTVLIGISITFLLTTLIPSVAFGKLFVREASALLILVLFQIPTEIILASTFVLWLFNLALPALVGTRLIFKK